MSKNKKSSDIKKGYYGYSSESGSTSKKKSNSKVAKVLGIIFVILQLAASVGFEIPDGATTISSICDGANPLSWIHVKAHELGIIGVAVAVVIALALAVWNRKRILKQAAEMHAGA